MKRALYIAFVALAVWLVGCAVLALWFAEEPWNAALVWTFALVLIGFVSWKERG